MKYVPLSCSAESYSAGVSCVNIRPGDFFLVHGDSPFARLVQLGQSLRFRGKDKPFAYWTHTGIFTSSQGDIVEADGMGVTQNHISYYKDMRYVVIHPIISEPDREEMMAFVNASVGEQYGWATILSIGISLLTGLKFSFGFDGQEICSGLVTRALERTTFIPKNDASHTTPADLARAFLAA